VWVQVAARVCGPAVMLVRVTEKTRLTSGRADFIPLYPLDGVHNKVVGE
jgi:hypothetical protein